MRNIYLFILIFFSVELFAQRSDTLTLWLEIQGYSYETDPFFKDYHGLGEIAIVSLVKIPDQNCTIYQSFSCIKFELSNFPEGVDHQLYFLHNKHGDNLDAWTGQSFPNGYNLYLGNTTEPIKLFGAFSFKVPDARFEIKHKVDDIYYIIRFRDPTTDAPDKLINTYPPCKY